MFHCMSFFFFLSDNENRKTLKLLDTLTVTLSFWNHYAWKRLNTINSWRGILKKHWCHFLLKNFSDCFYTRASPDLSTDFWATLIADKKKRKKEYLEKGDLLDGGHCHYKQMGALHTWGNFLNKGNWIMKEMYKTWDHRVSNLPPWFEVLLFWHLWMNLL